MKKILYIIGIGGIGYALYYYFTKQLALALDFDYKIKDAKVNQFTLDGVNLDLIISVLNKSSFALEVKNYDIDVFYEGILIGKANSNVPFTVQSDSLFDVPTTVNISFKGKKYVLGNLGVTLLGNKALKIDLKGKLNIVYANLPKEVLINVKDIEIYENLTESLGLNKPVDKTNEILNKLGIKV